MGPKENKENGGKEEERKEEEEGEVRNRRGGGEEEKEENGGKGGKEGTPWENPSEAKLGKVETKEQREDGVSQALRKKKLTLFW